MDILKVRFRSTKEFLESYARDLPTGGLFCPTTAEHKTGDTVIVEIVADDLPNKVLIRGAVKWWRPALPRLRVRAGALVEFDAEEKEKKDFVLQVLTGSAKPPAHLRKRIGAPQTANRVDAPAACRQRRRVTRQSRRQPLRQVIRQERRVAGDGEHRLAPQAERRGKASEGSLEPRRIDQPENRIGGDPLDDVARIVQALRDDPRKRRADDRPGGGHF